MLQDMQIITTFFSKRVWWDNEAVNFNPPAGSIQ